MKARGADAELASYHAALERLLPERPNARVIMRVEGGADDTYRSLVASLS